MHSPPLLILDEPTVGVDPLLRQNIWQHLVTLTQSEKISVIITTHYIEEARQANVVGLMRHGKILAENSPDELMRIHGFHNLEDVFLKLCVTDSALKSAAMASGYSASRPSTADSPVAASSPGDSSGITSSRRHNQRAHGRASELDYPKRWESLRPRDRIQVAKASRRLEASLFTRPVEQSGSSTGDSDDLTTSPKLRSDNRGRTSVIVNQVDSGNNTNNGRLQGYTNHLAVVENFSSEDSDDTVSSYSLDLGQKPQNSVAAATNNNAPCSEEYIALQAIKWASRRSQTLNLIDLNLHGLAHSRPSQKQMESNRWSNGANLRRPPRGAGLSQWWKTLMAVTWKNYMRLRRNPPVLIFQFMLPAIQVILFCICIGGEPFDVPVAVVNDEVDPRSSKQFLEGLDPKVIRQVRYDNLSGAIEAVKHGQVWGIIHIPDKYTENLQSRMIMGEDVNNETIGNGTIKVYPDLTSKLRVKLDFFSHKS